MTTTINALTTGGGGAVVSGDSSGALALQTNNGTTALSIDTSQNVTLTNPLALGSGGTGKTTASASLTNLTGYTTTATAAGTTTLTNTSSWFQYFTGGSTQTVVMPVTSTLVTGWSFHIINNSTGNITVNSSGNNLIGTIVPGVSFHITCIGTSLTTAADWDYGITDFTTTTGSGGTAVLSTTPTITNLVLAAGTASLAPLAMTSGTNLTAAVAGTQEYDGSNLYFTPDTSQGRNVILGVQQFYLSAPVTAFGATIGNFFGTTSAASLAATSTYDIECYCYFLKTTAGTLTWAPTFSTNATVAHATLDYTPITGFTTSAISGAMVSAESTQQTVGAMTFAATGSLTTAVYHVAKFLIKVTTNTACNFRLNVTQSAGTITPQAGSFYTVRKVVGSSGNFVA
jgi:hypothetical protein